MNKIFKSQQNFHLKLFAFLFSVYSVLPASVSYDATNDNSNEDEYG